MKCCVFVRFVYEFIYLDAFIEHYLDLGFDKVVILYHDVVEGYIEKKYQSRVLLFNVENLGNKMPDAYKSLIPKDIDWVLHVDSDEFLLLHKKYFTIHDYVREKLIEFPNKKINIIAFNWLWIHKFDSNNAPVNDIIMDYKKIVGNAVEQKKKELWIKCMFKRNELKTLYIHCPLMTSGHRMYSNGEVIEFKNNMNTVRSVSYKSETVLYKEQALVHLATRSLSNAIFKSERIHESQVQKKNIVSKMDLEREITFTNRDASPFELLKIMLNTIGYKVKFPLKCLKLAEAQIKLDDFIRIQSKNVNLECVEKDEKYYNLYSSILNNRRMKEMVEIVGNNYKELFYCDRKQRLR